MAKDYENKEMVMKTIRFDIETATKVQEMADNSERDFTGQVRFMIKEYIKLKESK